MKFRLAYRSERAGSDRDGREAPAQDDEGGPFDNSLEEFADECEGDAASRQRRGEQSRCVMANIAANMTGRKPLSASLRPLLVTIPVALTITGLGRTKLYELIGQGRVKTVQIGRRRLAVYSSLEALANPDDGEEARLSNVAGVGIKVA